MEGSNMASLWPFRSEQKPLLPIGFNSGQWGSGRIKSRLPTRTIRDPHPLAPTLKQGLIFLFYYYSQKNAFRIQRSYKAEDPRKYASLNNVSDCFISLDNVTEAQARGWWWVGGGGVWKCRWHDGKTQLFSAFVGKGIGQSGDFILIDEEKLFLVSHPPISSKKRKEKGKIWPWSRYWSAPYTCAL